METEIKYKAFSPDEHLSGVLGICRAIEWDNFHYDPDLTRKSLTAPGVTTIVAVSPEEAVAGFAQIQGDGVGLQTHLSLLAVDEGWRRKGIARRLVEEGFRRLGAARMDPTSSDEALDFYRTFAHREQTGFRLYPNPHTKNNGRPD
ncbi:MAG: GNAT family N-acetyltransferase [Rubrobacteraceae bacterium]|jgi:ribosomal protein S18 acetylase RimI-like enzyme|nr:GNAT family N-acetyltransferase [Rubrobacter sp.]